MADDVGAPLPFAEAIDFLAGKARLPTQAWTDLREGAHARSFVVAGATTDALVADFHRSIRSAIENGTTLETFRQDFDTIVTKHGWSYKGGRNWRSRVIYDTNMRMARAAGHWDRIERQRQREAEAGRTLYLRYVAVMDGRTRDEHKAWHGTVLPADHPWWRAHYPPNGWGCRCTVQALTERQLRRYGYSVTPDDQAPPVAMEQRTVTLADGSTETWETPAGLDTGFGYNVGRSWLSGAVPRELREPLPDLPDLEMPVPPNLPALPAPRPVDAARVLPEGLAPEAYAQAFLSEFGATVDQGALYRDAAGYVMGIDADLFRRRDGSWKVESQGRHRFLPVLAEALKAPDEIWLSWAADHTGRPVLRRTYLAALDLPRLNKMQRGHGLFALVEWSEAGWRGVTLFQSRPAGYLAERRRGVLLYRRPEKE
ncbi:PBECR2 nuclease fold domain-containing protein [Roseospira navarrensis]|uniref:Phage head morphogenesis domain-containing protein n=1 Tax=Roseospira navarrensis TaxID=140058 RepID=A0A7X1ZG83_9PROT|nr:PBECR2 nuclease fold domain-containing protein [Roseospira navarrensis]MQX36827.1 hypothetical protein [Roseospira navarrensis]